MTGSGDLSVAVWDIVDGTLVTKMKSHAASIRAVQVNKFDPCKWCVCVCALHKSTCVLLLQLCWLLLVVMATYWCGTCVATKEVSTHRIFGHLFFLVPTTLTLTLLCCLAQQGPNTNLLTPYTWPTQSLKEARLLFQEILL